MYKNILVALDGRPEADQALKQAVALARLCGAELSGISVMERLPAYAASVGEVDEVKQEMEAFFARVQGNAVHVAEAAGLGMTTAIKAGHAAKVIIQYAAEHNVDLIVVGADGHGLGGTADKITENAACSVLVARVRLPAVKVKEAMTREVTSIHPSTPLPDVLRLMVQQGLKAVPVIDNGQLVGMITGGDLLSRAGVGLRLSLQRTLPEDRFNEQIDTLDSEGKLAREIMTSPVVTIQEGEPITRAAAQMAEKQIKRLPVVNRQGDLVGIISRWDILALVAAGDPSSEIFPAISGDKIRTAGDIMFREVPIVDPDASLSEVIYQILSTPLRRVVVVDEARQVLGIIVDTDLVKGKPSEKTRGLYPFLSRFSPPRANLIHFTERARDVMSSDVYTVLPSTPLPNVIQVMIEKRIKRLVVTDTDRRLVGMVSRESILRVLAGDARD